MVLSGYLAKSMTTSYRSAIAWRRLVTTCGLGMNPASVAMTVIGTGARPSLSCQV